MARSAFLQQVFSPGYFKAKVTKIRDQTHEVLLANWHLGMTAFGGPPVHFQIFRRRFVESMQWIDDQTYQELFAIANSLPGPASTKMLFNINLIHGGFTGAVLAFLLWSLPGAVGMFGFSLGVLRIGDQLPTAVYALLSGLNAATVGIIALAAVQLSQKVITDQLSRALVFLGGACGMLYTALWYFPVLMAVAGIAAIMWDLKMLQRASRMMRSRGRDEAHAEAESSRQPSNPPPGLPNHEEPTTSGSDSNARASSASSGLHHTRQYNTRNTSASSNRSTASSEHQTLTVTASREEPRTVLTWRRGLCIIVVFLASFLTVMLIRGLYSSPTRAFYLFANLYLAGTIIFGGGPVVIPLLREYVVAEGWVSPRNFLLGLALIQAFPGPNFNFAVYLGALTLSNAGQPPLAGALVAFVAIFLPGLVVQTGFMGLWGSIRKNQALLSGLRGINAAAVGLVFTAVYRLWQIGYLDQSNENGQPLGGSPWWVVVTATSFVGGAWFGLNPPSAVVMGGVMGMIWYGVTQA